MNIYYLKRFRKKAYEAVMVQYYAGARAYTLEWRKSGALVMPLRYYTDLDKAKADLKEVRRTYILTITKHTRSVESEFDNKKLAKL